MSTSTPSIRVGEEQEVGLLKKQARKPKGAASILNENLGEKILIYMKNALWVIMAGFVIYYSNFFHNLFHNPNINELFFEIAMAGYTILVMLMLFAAFIMPRVAGTDDIEEYNPKLAAIGAAVGVVSIISLLIAIWPVWGFWSFPIFITLWKGFFGISLFLPGGQFGGVLFVIVNALTVLSFYIIEHEGYLH